MPLHLTRRRGFLLKLNIQCRHLRVGLDENFARFDFSFSKLRTFAVRGRKLQ